MSAPLIIPLQASFTPGSTQMESFDWQFLCYSSIGGILACLDSGTPSYNVKFRDSEIYTDYAFNDLRRYSMGSLSSHGALFAMPIQEPHTRTGSNRPPSTEDQRAYVFYRPHNDNDSRNRWEALLPEGEDIQTIVATVKGPVITTTTGLVRYFSCFGLQYHVAMAPSSTILSSVACEQWLMHVYHIAAEPGKLRLGYTLIDLNSLTEENCGSLTLTPGGALEWIGFGEDGTPSCTDSEGLVQILLNPATAQAHWIPVLQIHPGRLFPFGLSRGKLHCLRIAADPSWISQPICQEVGFKLPVAQMSHGNLELEEQLLVAQINTQLILGEEPSRNSVPLQSQHLIEDKLILQLIHVACKANRPQQVVELSLMLNCNDSLVFAEKLAASASMTDAVNRIKEFQKLSSSKVISESNKENVNDFVETFSSDENMEDKTVPSSPHNTSPSLVDSTPALKKANPTISAPANPFSVKVHKNPHSSKNTNKSVQLSTPRKRQNRVSESDEDMPSKSPFLSARRGCSILVSPQVSQSTPFNTSTPTVNKPSIKAPQSKVKCQLPISDSD